MVPGPTILMVDDDVGDLRLTREAVERVLPDGDLHFVHSGDDAMSFLSQAGAYQGSPRPDAILLDLRMVGMTGMECLEQIRGRRDWNDILVFVLSSSARPADRQAALTGGADRFLTKPRDLDEYLELVGDVVQALDARKRADASPAG